MSSSDRWRRIEELFHAALGRDARERNAFLTTACDDDDELRHEVESLLAQASQAEQYLDPQARLAMLYEMTGESRSWILGRRLGSYEVVELLGVGGMGEVYRARDTKLGRDVAIKVLPPTLVADRARLARFEREARLLASVNHPHIAAIYGVEESEGTQALVLELIEGPTLAERLQSGPLTIKGALTAAQEVAEALEAAHEHGIVHRDLKPANIKFTRSGAVKVLDFGLAKAELADVWRPGQMQSRAVADGATREGVFLGTPGYMSPEQATGQPADRRSDVWAFGCILFEMLSGYRAFEGENLQGVLTATLVGQPDWSRLPPHVPSSIRRLVERCLERDVRRRTGDIAAVRIVLEEVGGLTAQVGQVESESPVGVAAPRMWSRISMVGAIVLTVGAAIGAAIAKLVTHPAVAAVTRTMITTPPPAELTTGDVAGDVALSPDGTRVVYIGNKGTQVFVRSLDRLDPVAIAAGASVRSPFVSPDGQWVGFIQDGVVLKKVPMSGGPAVTVAVTDGTGPRGATWSTDDSIIIATSSVANGLWLIPAAGGASIPLTRPDRERGEAQHLWPERLPGGHSVLFTITAQTGGLDATQIAVLDLRTGTQKVLMRGGSHAHYVTSGHLIYAAAGTLRAVPFDLDRLQVRGAGVEIVPRLLTSAQGASDFAVVGDSLVYVDAPGAPKSEVKRTLTWVDRSGHEDPIGTPQLAYIYPRLSPDGSRLALDIGGQARGLWIWDFRRATLTRLTIDSADNRSPEWTRDSKRILYTSNRGGADNLWWQWADGTGVPGRLSAGGNVQLADASTPDGSAMIFHERKARSSADLMVLTLDGNHRVTPLLETPFNERNGFVSEDGRWITYESDSSGQYEIYVRPFSDPSGGQWQVSIGGGTRPLWSRDGKELFYVVPTPTAPIMRVPIETSGATFHAGPPVRLFENYDAPNPGRTYDVSADGRFILIKPPQPGQLPQPSLIVVQHWAEELKRLVPTR